MMKFMFILMLLMAAMMSYWLILAALIIWFGWTKVIPKLTDDSEQPTKQPEEDTFSL